MYKVFYTDHVNNVSVASSNPVNLIKEDVLHSMRVILYSPGNFIGLIDAEDSTLQFIVNTDLTVRMEIPDPGKYGSFYKNVSLDACIGIVENLEGNINQADFTGMEFQAW